MFSPLVILLTVALVGAALFVTKCVAASPEIVFPAPHVPLDNDKLLRMIELVENWDGEAIGRSGEAGPWQMKVKTWHDYSHERMPYLESEWRGPEAQRVLHEHASWIRDEIEKNRLPDTSFNFALCWKVGFSGFLHGKTTYQDARYALRAETLYGTLK